jgi:hypothetical protein
VRTVIKCNNKPWVAEAEASAVVHKVVELELELELEAA